MDVRFISASGVEHCKVNQLLELLGRKEGFVWVDMRADEPDVEAVLSKVFCFHPRAVKDCLERNAVPKTHVYADHVLAVLHAPQPGQHGHVHYVELDQLIGPNYLVTVHGPVNPAVPDEAMYVETAAVANRLDAGRLRPPTAYVLSSSIVSALITRLHDDLAMRTKDVWRIEQEVTGGTMGDVEEFLDDMFRVRHGLIVVRTMATMSAEIYGRLRGLEVYGAEGQRQLDNSLDQFTRLATTARSQEEYLQGVIGFYQTRTNTKMTIAAERLAVIAAVTLPITALSSIVGMNVIVNDATQPGLLGVLLAVMGAMSVVLLIWAKRRGWW
jgi:Mg2+ and Co2+ transporter CorA